MTEIQQLDLFDQASMADTITVTGTGAQPVLTISNGGILGTGLYGTDTLSVDWNRLNNVSLSNRLQLTGDDADIEINGESVVSMLRDIRDRLAILRVSDEMEAEWHELRQLRSQYEAKLAECESKSRAWKALQQRG
jgi:myo-inositol-hexaphosphate 3-phosphohydrolase